MRGMRIGMMARADHTGLGAQCREVHAHLHPAKTLVVDVCDLSPKNLVLHPEWYPGARVTTGFPSAADVDWLLTDVDVIYSAETFYSNAFVQLVTERGVATVLHVNPEFLDHLAEPALPKPTLFACPTPWLYDRIPEPKALLRMPVATERFSEREHPGTAHHFRHVIGWPAIHDRAGTPELMGALRLVTSPIRVTVACQDPTYAAGLLKHSLPARVQLQIEAIDYTDYWDALGDADVLVSPRRFGGLNLGGQEALAAGVPTIMPDISPNQWLPRAWLVPAERIGRFMTRTSVDYYAADPPRLAALIDRFATDSDFYTRACAQARELAQTLSWENLMVDFEDTFADAVQRLDRSVRMSS